MTVGVGLLIEAADYNAIRAKINSVMGVGSGNTGYGQALYADSDVSAGQLVTASQLTNLQKDIIRARLHQVGSGLTGLTASNPVTSSGSLIQSTHFSTLNTDADLVSNGTEKFKLHSSQTSNDTIITATRTTSWNNPLNGSLLTHTAILTFDGYSTPTPPTGTISVSAANHVRAFFNSGGKVRISADRSGGTVSIKNTAWTNMLNQIGEVWISYDQTVSSLGSGTGSAIGWYNLTTTNQKVYQKDYSGSYYSANSYVVYARTNLAATQLILSIQFQDNATGGVDEDVDGTLNSYVGVYRASSTDSNYPFNVTAPSNGGSLLDYTFL